MTDRRVVVVGGGVTGLSAAYRLIEDHPDLEVILFEASPQAGGSLVTSNFLNLPVDEGADSFLVRVPWAVRMFEELGISRELVAPRSRTACVWLDGSLRKVPIPNVLGIPLDVGTVEPGLLSDADQKRLTGDGHPNTSLPENSQTDGDLTVGQLVRSCLGDGILDRLVDPLLGGINAGRADDMSCAITAPQLLKAARNPAGLLAALRQSQGRVGVSTPVFNSHPAGMGYLASRLVSHLGSVVNVSHSVQSLATSGHRWSVRTNGTEVTADGVILATPAPTTSALLRATCPDAARLLGNIQHASVALALMAWRRSDLNLPAHQSGFLVPRSEGLFMTACSFANSKWAHLDDDSHSILRVSMGRIDDNRHQSMSEKEILAALATNLAITLGVETPPIATRVRRWNQSLAQFPVGHGVRMVEVASALAADAPRLAVAGSYHYGVGIPACIRSGWDAATAIATGLG